MFGSTTRCAEAGGSIQNSKFNIQHLFLCSSVLIRVSICKLRASASLRSLLHPLVIPKLFIVHCQLSIASVSEPLFPASPACNSKIVHCQLSIVNCERSEPIRVNLWFKFAKLADKNGQHDVLSLQKTEWFKTIAYNILHNP